MEKTPLLVDDVYSLKSVSGLVVTPDHVYFVEQNMDQSKNSYKSHIKVLDRISGQLLQFTAGNKRDFSPKISPNGQNLAFISTRFEKPQIMIMSLTGGEALKYTGMDGVANIEWSPDSSKLSFTAQVISSKGYQEEEPPKDELEMKIKELKKEYEKKDRNDPKVINNLVYRVGTSYLEEQKTHQLFVLDVADKKISQVSACKNVEVVYNYTGAKWLDNQTIVAVAKRDRAVDTDVAHVFSFNIDEISTGKNLGSFSNLYAQMPPEVSKGGQILVSISTDTKVAGQNNNLSLLKDGEFISINRELDRSVNMVKWIDEETLVAAVADNGYVDLRKVNLSNLEYEKLFETDSSILEFDFTGPDTIYFVGTDPLRPSALWKWDKQTNTKELVYDPNEEFLSEKLIVEPEEFWMDSVIEGIKFQGWFFDAGDNSPLILSIHGGPHVMWTNADSMWHEWQTSIGRGYSILALNPIGSSGYGEKFSQIITSKWGVDDAQDLLKAVDKFSDRVDTDRLYITGGSYAGFQVANVVARDHRFKAACAQRGVFNLISFWSTTDIPQFGVNEMEGNMWERLETYWDISPISRAREIQTPLLIIHSENDFRVPISQAEELFGALKYLGKEVQLVRYPRDGHELSRSGEPKHIIDRITRMLDWFDKYQ